MTETGFLDTPLPLTIPLVLAMLCAAALEAADGAPSPTKEPSAMERFEVFANGQDGFHTIRIPTIVVTTRGTVLAIAEGRKDSAADDTDIDLVARRSTDGGETWSAIQTIYSFGAREGGRATTGNPCPIVDRDTGEVVLLFSRDNRTAHRTISTDDGRTWSEPVEITETFRRLDYEGLVRVAPGPGHGVQLAGGRLLAPVWISNLSRRDKQRLSRKLEGAPGKLREHSEAQSTAVVYSDDHGRTWKPGGVVPAAVPWLSEASMFPADDGSLVLNMRAHLGGFRAQSVSRDRGLTWSDPVLRKDLPDPTCHGSTLKLVHGPLAGAVVFTNLDQAKRERTKHCLIRRNLTARLSLDDGTTWPHARLIAPGPSGYSDLAQLPDGRVLCIFENGDKIYRERVSLVRFAPAWLHDGATAGNESP